MGRRGDAKGLTSNRIGETYFDRSYFGYAAGCAARLAAPWEWVRGNWALPLVRALPSYPGGEALSQGIQRSTRADRVTSSG